MKVLEWKSWEQWASRVGFVAVVGAAAPAAAQTGDPIEYELRFPEASSHYMEIEASYPTGGRESIEVMMAVWTPGSYLVREYARHVEDVEAATPDGRDAEVVKTRKNRWRIETGGADRVSLRYRVYGREMTVRTNWIEEDFAILNGAPTFLTLVGGHELPHDVTLRVPAGWSETWTAAPPHPDGAPHHYLVPDFDTLVDSPIYAGNPEVHEFEVGGKMHYLVNHGGGDVWDGPRSAADVRRIVEEALRLWGELPYERYVFLNMITESGGGLEHKDSTLMMTSRWRSRVPEDYRRWLGLVSHEYFHAWNIKRLRPKSLGPFDYENEVYSRSLWVGEGVTSYYDDLQLRRAGLYDDEQYLKALGSQIASLQTTPGRKVRPVELASYDAWIRGYRPDENSANVFISYYTKGSVVAFLLDAEIQRATDGERSLDDMMRMAFELYSGERGFTPVEFRAVASEIAGTDLSGWFETALETTEELSYDRALDWFGLRFAKPGEESEEEGETAEEEPDEAWTGLVTRDDDGRLVVSRVLRETPGHTAGVNVGDEILAIDDYRVEAGGLSERLEQYRPGQEIELLVARRERLRRIPLTLGTEPPEEWTLEVDPEADEETTRRRERWLTGAPR